MSCARVRVNYGNDGCDGFAPNFPLIRTKRNQTANKYSINDITHHYAEIIIPQKFDFVNGFEKMEQFHIKIEIWQQIHTIQA